jgi:hypothetical protein
LTTFFRGNRAALAVRSTASLFQLGDFRAAVLGIERVKYVIIPIMCGELLPARAD